MSVPRGPVGLSLLLLSLSGVALTTACAPSDPREAALEERARWKIELLSWAGAPDGSMTLSVRASGPTSQTLERLTVWVELLDAAGAVIGAEWVPVDLSDIRRGGPKDLILRLPARELEAEVDGISIDTVADPTPEQAAHMKELDI